MPKRRAPVPLIRNIFDEIEEYHSDRAATRSLMSAQKAEMRRGHAEELEELNVRLKALQHKMKISNLYAKARSAGYLQGGTSVGELKERLYVIKLQMAPHVTKRSRARKSRMKKQSK